MFQSPAVSGPRSPEDPPLIAAIVETGVLRLPSPDRLSPAELSAEAEWLCRFEEDDRLRLPGPAPPVQAAAVTWAVDMLLRSAQFVAFRHLGEEALNRELLQPCPGPRDSAVDYSVDLAFRFLPDLYRIAHSTSQSDPLLAVFDRWGTEWPLSTVGMPLGSSSPLRTEFLMQHETLSRLYADRILAKQDRARLREDGVRTAVREWIGYYPELGGGLRDLLVATS